MDYSQLVSSMTPELYRRLKQAVELGRWPDGRPLDAAQRRNALQAVILWDRLYGRDGQRVGRIDRGRKAGPACDPSQEQPLTLIDDNGGAKR